MLDVDELRKRAAEYIDVEPLEYFSTQDEVKLQTLGIDEMREEAHKEIPWLLLGYLYAKSLAMVFGLPKCGKTHVIIDMAMCIATGLPFLGRYPVHRQGLVLYIAGEGASGVSQRVMAWGIHRNIAPEDFTSSKIPFRRTQGSVQMLAKGQAEAIISECQRLSEEAGLPIVAIFIDTVARNFGDGDENSTPDMGRFVAECDKLKDAFGCLVCLAHHTGRQETDRPRGSIALDAALDTLIKVSGAFPAVDIEVKYHKDAEHPDPVSCTAELIDLGVTGELTGKPVKSIALTHNGEPPFNSSELVAEIQSGLGVTKAQALMMACLYHAGEQKRVMVSKSEVNALFKAQGGTANTTKVQSALVKRQDIAFNQDGASMTFTDVGFEGWDCEAPLQ